MKIVTKNDFSVTNAIPHSLSSSRDKIHRRSAKNFIYCRRNSPLIENKSSEAVKLMRWLQMIIPLSQHFNFFGCFHISEKNIIQRRKTSGTKEEIHLIERKIPLQQIKKSIAAEDYSCVTTSSVAENSFFRC
jgi:hypothetical protein